MKKVREAALRPLSVIHSEREYDAAVKELDRLIDLDPKPRTPAHARLELLGVLIEAYDDEHYELGGSGTPQSIVDFMLEQEGLTRADLADLMGGRSRVSDFFKGKRRLSLGQIVKLRKTLGIPADLLIPAGG